MRSALIPLLLPAMLASEPPAGSFEHITLPGRDPVQGFVLDSNQLGMVIQVIAPSEVAGLRHFAADPLAEPTSTMPADADHWVARWRACIAGSEELYAEADATALADALDEAEASQWRQALSGMKTLLGRREAPPDVEAVDRLVRRRTDQSLPEFLAELQLQTAAAAMKRSAFRLWYRPTIEAEVLGARLDAVHDRVIEVVVPTTREPEDLARFLFMVDDADDDSDADATATADVDLNPPRAHAISAWFPAPADYDGAREAAVRMQQRVTFDLQVLKARLAIARQQKNKEDERRVLAARAQLFELQKAVQNRASGGLTPDEREARRREAEAAAAAAIEAERQRRRVPSNDDDDDDDD